MIVIKTLPNKYGSWRVVKTLNSIDLNTGKTSDGYMIEHSSYLSGHNWKKGIESMSLDFLQGIVKKIKQIIKEDNVKKI